MRKPKNNKGLLSEKEQLKTCIEFIKSHGYGVFKVGADEVEEEKESVEKLKAIGYKIEHIKDSRLKIEPCRINSADDVVVYFYEKLKRHNKKLLDSNKLKDKKYRMVDCSVINSLIKWRMGEGLISLTEAIEDIFIMIDVLFEKAVEWQLNIYGVGILSITNSKPLILTLLREVNMQRDSKLNYEITYKIHTDDAYNYINLLEEAKKRIQETEVSPKRRGRRKIKV